MKMQVKNKEKIYIFLIFGHDRDWPCSYVFPSMMENHGLRSSG